MSVRSGSGWSPGGLGPAEPNTPFLVDGIGDGPRIGPRLFLNDYEPHHGGSFILYLLAGLTLDASGAVLAACTVRLFETATNLLLQTTVSDGIGSYSFTLSNLGTQCFLVAYLASAPDVYGTTVNTITAS